MVVVFGHSVVSDSLWPHGLYLTRLLCPWDSSGTDTGVGCYSLLQGIFLTQGWNPGLLHWQVDSLLISQVKLRPIYLHHLFTIYDLALCMIGRAGAPFSPARRKDWNSKRTTDLLSILPSPAPQQTLEALRPLLWCRSRSFGLPVLCGKHFVPHPRAHSSCHSAGGLSLLVISSTGQICWGIDSPSLAAVLHRWLTQVGGYCLAPQTGQPRGHTHSFPEPAGQSSSSCSQGPLAGEHVIHCSFLPYVTFRLPDSISWDPIPNKPLALES